MGVSKGINNFSGYQTERVEFLKKRIDVYLDDLRKKNVSYDSLRELIDFLCPILTKDWINECKKTHTRTKPSPISKSTLYRNSEYRTKLEMFMSGLPQEEKKSDNKDVILDMQEQIKKLKKENAELENELLKKENDVAKLNNELSKLKKKKLEKIKKKDVNDNDIGL